MEQYDLVVIGSGASGLSAATRALREGIKNVLILESDEVLGGNLNLFINNGYGKDILGQEVTGPELASILIEEFNKLGGKYKVNTRVLDINRNKIINYINPEEGIVDIQGKTIIVATGCRERFTGNIVVPIHKYTGIFTRRFAHKLVNLNGFLPGKDIIISGGDIWTAILARRFVIEGANVKAMITEQSQLEYEINEIIEDFNIPVVYNSEITEVGGDERVQWVKVNNYEENEEKFIYGDSLILSIGYLPELEVLKKLKINKSPQMLNHYDNEVGVNGIFICGTAANGINNLLNSENDGDRVGKIVADYIKKCLY